MMYFFNFMCMLCDKCVILHKFVEKSATELKLNDLPYSTVNKSSMSMSRSMPKESRERSKTRKTSMSMERSKTWKRPNSWERSKSKEISKARENSNSR